MATAIEYGLISAGISLAIIAVVHGTSGKLFDDEIEKKQATTACAARPANDTKNVFIRSAFGGITYEYRCSNWPWPLNGPSLVRRAFK